MYTKFNYVVNGALFNKSIFFINFVCNLDLQNEKMLF